ncbi:MAG: ribonuclease Y [Actinomycetota bacterium]
MEAAVALAALVVGIGVGFAVRAVGAGRTIGSAESRAQRLVLEAEREAERITREALVEATDTIGALRRETEDDLRTRREEMTRAEQRAAVREETYERKLAEVERRTEELNDRDHQLRLVREELQHANEQHRLALEKVAQMTSQEAKDAILAQVVDQARREAMVTVREIEQRAREDGEERARKIVTVAIQRVATEQTADSSVSVFTLPSEDMKGRIIGREGRNIRAFESVTGVNLIIDDTPEAVVLSCFDPVRREVARMTLELLVADGRIHPARIEEVHERCQRDIEERIRRAGEDATLEVGITDLHPELVRLLGQLQYRTSYGQNVLRHLVESAQIASSIAAELGVDPKIAKRGAFLHDIGKAVSHEVEGSHAIIGAEIARRLGESEPVVHCIEAHHGEVEQRTIDAVLAHIADAISAGRPGARRESLETYVKRLHRLEEICSSYPGVEKTYAMQAGRDVRVMVKPQDIDDVAAQILARDIAKQVEEELQYPGQIKITVVRETRATEFAR